MMTSKLVLVIALVLAGFACGGRLAEIADGAETDAGQASEPSCDGGTCVIASPPTEPFDSSVSDTVVTPEAASGADGSGEEAGGNPGQPDAGLFGPCLGMGNILHFEIGGGSSGPVRFVTDTVRKGSSGPTGPAEPGGLFLNLQTSSNDGMYVTVPAGDPVGAFSIAFGPVVANYELGSTLGNDMTCTATSGMIDIVGLDVADSGVSATRLEAFFDLLVSDCQATGSGSFTSNTEVRGCVGWNAAWP